MDLNTQYLLATIVESSDDAIITKTLEGIITSWNKGAEKVFGYKADEVIGKSISILIPPDRSEEEPNILAKIRRGEKIDHFETVRKRKDGRLIDISLTVSPIRNAEGEIIGASKIARDLTECKKADELQSRLAAIVESSDDAIISKTLDGIITSWNKGAEKIFGYTAEEVIGKPIVILIPPGRENEEPGILERLRRGEKVDHYETVRLTKDGRLLDISLTVSPVNDSKGNIVGASKIARDITERKKAEREVHQFLEREQEARRQAEEANRTKDEFIATVSHELRTPLTAMLGWVRLLRTSALSAETAKKALETIERNVKSQAQLIEDLLDISRITTGKLRLNLQTVDLGSVVKSATDAVRPAASAKNIKLQMILGDEALVYGDYERLQQIMWNLLSNAIKFTPKGGKVQVELDRVDSHIELTVTDTGEGIKAEFLPYIFNRFTQADSSISRPYGGLGLGLAIVKHIAELHGGTVRAFSEGVGKGATFTLTLPIKAIKVREMESQQLPKTDLSSVKTSHQNKELSGQRLLVVDDEPDTLILMKTIFEEYGAEVEVAQSVDMAIEILDNWMPTLLVSDISMPGRNGLDLIQHVRARSVEKGGNIPAVALTAYARVEDRVKVLSAGYQMHIPKPVEPSELVTIVSGLTKIIH